MEEENVQRDVGVNQEAMEKIADRLSFLDNLYFPRAVLPNASSPSLRKSLLLDLLHRNIPVFLGNSFYHPVWFNCNFDFVTGFL